MLRRSVRERKVYLHRKGLEAQEENLLLKKRSLKHAIEEGKPISSDLRNEEATLRNTLSLEDSAAENRLSKHQDDEYASAGIKDPKVVITTSRDPSSRLQQFAKELRLLFPYAQRVNRGSYVIKDIIHLCKSNDVTDILLIHETRGQPDCLVICHLPYGPTAYFALSDVILRHDLPERPAPMSEVSPHLIFHNFTSKLGSRMKDILRYLFPYSKQTGQRVHSFVNHNDRILFRHFVWDGDFTVSAKEETDDASTRTVKQRKMDVLKKETKGEERIILTEVGPRFSLRPFRIELGTMEMKDLECEWTLRPYFNKPKSTLS